MAHKINNMTATKYSRFPICKGGIIAAQITYTKNPHCYIDHRCLGLIKIKKHCLLKQCSLN